MPDSAFYETRNFLTPAFRIEIDGRDAGRDVIADVLEVAFTDDLDNVNSFEFVLYDWDAMTLRPKYSSPWDETGSALTVGDTNKPVPNFEPGAQVALYMGYLEDGDLPLIMEGEVVSIAPSFPAAGAPTCRVRALNAFLRGMQKIRIDEKLSGTPKAVVDTICQTNGITVEWSTIEDEGEEEETVPVDGLLYDEVAKRAGDYGLKMLTKQNTVGDTVLFLASPSEGNDDPVVDFVWGRSLISFSPVLSAANQISAVKARGGNPDEEGEGQQVEATKTWSDIGLKPDALGPVGVADLETAVQGMVEVIKPDGVETTADAEAAALAHLRGLAAEMITASGTSVGLPELRAGATFTVAAMGARFNGTYRIKQVTHTINGSGYLTAFQCRKEVLENG